MPGLLNTASVNVAGPGDLRIAEGLIDNPNSMPVSVVVLATAPGFIRRGLRFTNVEMGSAATVVRSCDRTGMGPTTPAGRCALVQADTGEYGTDEVFNSDLVSSVVVDGAVSLGPGAEGRPVFQIAPFSTAKVWLMSSPWTFLMSSAPSDYPTFGPLKAVTGFVGSDWLRCVRTAVGGFGEDGRYCTAQVLMREFTELVRATVHPSSEVTLLARPTDSSDPSFAPATGTNVTGFGYANFGWDAQAGED